MFNNINLNMKDNILTLNQCRKSNPMSSSTDKRKPCIEMKVGKNFLWDFETGNECNITIVYKIKT